MNPLLGCWVTRDPIGYSAGDVNISSYVHQTPLVAVDPTGRELYVVDGTGNEFSNPSNATRFFYEYQTRMGIAGTKYWPGPATYEHPVALPGQPVRTATGTDSPAILASLMSHICQDYCHARRNGKELTIDLVGYSRGAEIIATAARNLEITGCDCGYCEEVTVAYYDRLGRIHVRQERKWNANTQRGIKVRWVGLFDAVAMMDPLSANTPGGWAGTSSPNVQSYSHVVHTADTIDQTIFPSQRGIGNPYEWPGPPSTHSQIGQDPKVLQWMINQAGQANVIPRDIMELPPAPGSR